MVADRDRLVEEHLELVQTIAAKLRRRLGKTMELGDLIAYGTKGLIEAAAKFDPRHGHPFASFAYYRIRGAMFDGMRTMGWYSRGDYARYRAEERANEYLASAERQDAAAHAAGAPVSDKTRLVTEIAELLSGVATVHITSIESARDVPDDRFASPADYAEANEERTKIREALTKLPEKERRLIELYYFADMNLDTAGAELGLSKSWASRLHARAIRHLRDLLAQQLEEGDREQEAEAEREIEQEQAEQEAKEPTE